MSEEGVGLIGRRFGKLTVVERADPAHGVRWLCNCDCGGEKTARSTDLKRGHTKSCGCMASRVPKVKHGMTNHPLYHCWAAMRQRCGQESDPRYADYGGRGIKVCKRWSDFPLFVEDMGNKTDPSLSIDRIDNDKGYSPDNCKWSTQSEQNKNRRSKGPSGVVGVIPRSGKSPWVASIRVDGKLIHLGLFDSIEEAARCRRSAELKYWGKIYQKRMVARSVPGFG